MRRDVLKSHFPHVRFLLPSFTIAASLALVLAVALLPGVPSGRYAQDFTALLDGAYRLEHGQLPHRDFMVPFGGLVIVQAWAALKLDALAPSFALLQISSWLLLLPAALALAMRQPSRPRAVTLLLVVGAMALVPYIVEWEPIPELNYNAIYNRTASAALFLLFVWTFGPKRPRIDAGLLAWLLLLGFGWKISHALAMLGVLCLAGLLSPCARRIGLRAVLLSVAALIVLDLATSGVVRAYGRDIAEMARINRGGSVYFLAALAIRTLPALICATLAVGRLVGRRAHGAGLPLRRIARRPVALLRAYRHPLWIVATVLAVLATESQGTGNLTLFPVVALAFGPFGRVLRPAEPGRRSRADRVATALVAVLLVTAAYPFAETVLRRAGTMAIRQAASMRREPALDPVVGRVLVPASMSETAERYRALWHGPGGTRTIVQEAEAAFTGGLNAKEPAMSLAWAREVVAMAELVRRRDLVRPAMRVTTIGYVEPFGRILGAAPTPGTRLWLDPQRTVGTLSPEEARTYLARADAVFVQRCPLRPPLQDMIERSFRAALGAAFHQADSTGCYEVWLRRT